MGNGEQVFPLLVLLLGGVILLAILIRAGSRRVGIPSMVGFLLVGMAMRLIDLQAQFLSSGVIEVFDFLGTIGLIILLFRVGLESNIAGLIGQIKRASIFG